MLFKLSKGLLKTSINVYIADVYNSSKNSSYTKRNECNIKFSPNNMVFMGGDFNSRISTQNDFIDK